ncbi:hypothetical protein [Paenarthrobacter aromaticivorans]|uniref:hypothetical protein n=1 Tax=Paenarthrobacter aromaticivorans TaxID=2849150 RepID=UPI003A81301A
MNLGTFTRLLRRRMTQLHTALLALALFGILIWVLSSDERWLALPFAAVASAVLLLGTQLQFSVDTTQTLKNNGQKRHAALMAVTQQLESKTVRQTDSIDRQFKTVLQDLAKVTDGQQLKAVHKELAKLAAQGQALSDQQRFRFAEIIDLYQDHLDRQQAFELRLRRLVDDPVESQLSTVAGNKTSEAAAETSSSRILSVDALVESLWPSVQNHIWMRDLYARSGSIAPRSFLASPENMKAGAFLAGTESVLVDWGIDSLTFHLAEERSRLGMLTVAVEVDDRLADIAAQALGANLKTLSTGSLATKELGYELGALITEPAGLLVNRSLDDNELARLAAVLNDLHLVETVYLTSAPIGDGGSTVDVLANAGFSRSQVSEESTIDGAGLELWQRAS